MGSLYSIDAGYFIPLSLQTHLTKQKSLKGKTEGQKVCGLPMAFVGSCGEGESYGGKGPFSWP
jgi:hypothetical protein